VDRINLLSAEGDAVDVSEALGSTAFAMVVYDVPPGGASAPYHYEYEEEWLLVVEGEITVRAPDGEHALERGDLVRFPAGPDGAHNVMNRSEAPARALLFSRTGPGVAVVVYPDSDTVAVWGSNQNVLFRRDSAVPLSERFRE